MNNRSKAFIFTLMITFLISGNAYAKGPFDKLGRGLVNIVLSPVEVIYQSQRMYVENNEAVAWAGGVPKGLFFFPIRLLAGVYDVVTFLIPLPHHYESIIKPDTLIEGFENLTIP